jgi:hypothetical protein
LRLLIDSFGDQTAILASLVLLERRPVLVKGFMESKVLRELRFLTPHRDLYETGRNMPNTVDDARQFISNLLDGEGLPTNNPLKRSLILAPNINSGFAEELLSFNKAWVASCVTAPKQENIQKSNAAIYDINCRKWLNLDTSRVETSWISRVIQQSTTKRKDELGQAYLDLVITDISKKASTLYKYINGGATEPREIWRDLGDPNQQTRAIIKTLCKSEFSVDVSVVLGENGGSSFNEEPPMCKQRMGETGHKEPHVAESLIKRIAVEENRIKKCIETVESKLGRG